MTAVIPYRWHKREASFFCIGMALIPVFWAWWTFLPRFKPWQRLLAFAWMITYVALIVMFPDRVRTAVDRAVMDFHSFCLLSGLVLWVWLIARLSGCGTVVMLFIVSIDIIAVLSSLMMGAMQRGGLDWFPPAFMALPVLCHLMLNEHQRRRKEGTRARGR